jgi:hypothetical protein
MVSPSSRAKQVMMFLAKSRGGGEKEEERRRLLFSTFVNRESKTSTRALLGEKRGRCGVLAE